MADLEKIYKERRDRVYTYMASNKIALAVFHDSEENREPALRYLTGLPSDGVLVLSADGKSTLCPWDENLARERAFADIVIPFTKYQRSAVEAVKEIVKSTNASGHPIISLSPCTPYPSFKKYEEALKDWTVRCTENDVHSFVKEMRSQKDEYEIECTKKACSITSAMTDEISQMVMQGKLTREIDVALFIERRLREEGCERTSFDTLAAGSTRSFAIHAFPGYTASSWGTEGLSILDYGVCYEGYASDCTITIARNVNSEQTRILDLVEKAAHECLPLYAPGKPIINAVKKADEIFATADRIMPHGLGHGTGLEIHEEPFISPRGAGEKVFKPGNIVTLEPGLYDPALGGCRLENDVLITETGNEVLTNSKIFRL